MTLFEIVKIVLDELYIESTASHKDITDRIIIERMEYLSKSYTALGDQKITPIDYRDPATRFAYVYKYVASHGDYIVQLMEGLRSTFKDDIFRKKELLVSCLGGGPGSDIIAIVKYLFDYPKEPVENITFYLLDKQQAWSDTWTELNKTFKDININTCFQPFDITDINSWEHQKKFLQADVFTLSYFVSEVRGLDTNGLVKNSFKKIFNQAKPGALILYVDNGNDIFNEYFDAICEESELDLLFENTNHKKTPRISEQCSELKNYTAKFNQNPKLQSFLSFRALRKN